VVRDAGFIDQAIEYQDMSEQGRWFAALKANPGYGLIDQRNVAASRASWNGTKGNTSEFLKKLSDLFIDLVKGKRRTSIVFRFEKNSSELDARALQDGERLFRYLKSQGGGVHSAWFC
jgi:hypothetical protein